MKFSSFLLILTLFWSCSKQKSTVEKPEEDNSFTVAFMTDIHLQPEKNAVAGFDKAIEKVNELAPDFVITGGDLVMDVLGEGEGRADTLFDMYKEEVKKFNMPIYHTIGNHEFFGVYQESGIDTTHPDYGHNLFEKEIGKRYQSFEYNGWYFMILDAIDTKGRKYIGQIDEEQIDWIKEELKKLDKKTPIVISVHIPMISTFLLREYGPLEENGEGLMVINTKEVLDLFEGYNLKLVLQGHTHYIEDIFVKNVHFVSGGAVCGKWWEGSNKGFEEGFLLLEFSENEFEWKYVDYGWEVNE
jgi:Icc protein